MARNSERENQMRNVDIAYGAALDLSMQLIFNNASNGWIYRVYDRDDDEVARGSGFPSIHHAAAAGIEAMREHVAIVEAARAIAPKRLWHQRR